MIHCEYIEKLEIETLKLIFEGFNQDQIQNDITSQTLIFQDSIISENYPAFIKAKQNGIFVGEIIFFNINKQLNLFGFSNIEFKILKKDGDLIYKDEEIAHLWGFQNSILACERTLLNIISFLSGIATETYDFQKILKHSKILDTRKVLPAYLYSSKYAVLCGQGLNHRMNLSDQFLIKENHLKNYTIEKAIENCQKKDPKKLITIEVKNLQELQKAYDMNPNRIMLDNFSNDMIIEALKFRLKQNILIDFEVSGNIHKNRLQELKDLPIEYYSVGKITHSVNAFDFSLIIP